MAIRRSIRPAARTSPVVSRSASGTVQLRQPTRPAARPAARPAPKAPPRPPAPKAPVKPGAVAKRPPVKPVAKAPAKFPTPPPTSRVSGIDPRGNGTITLSPTRPATRPGVKPGARPGVVAGVRPKAGVKPGVKPAAAKPGTVNLANARPGQKVPITPNKKQPKNANVAYTELTPEQQAVLGYALPYATEYGRNPLHLPEVGGFTPEQAAQLQRLTKVPPGKLTPAQRQTMQRLQKAQQASHRPMDRVANFDAQQKAGQEQALLAAKRQNELAAQAQKGFNFLTSGDLLDVSKNQYFDPAAKAAAKPITQALMEQELPGLRNAAASSGNFGSSRQGIAEALATQRANQAIGDTTGKMAMEAYGQGLNAYQNALGMAPQVQGMQTAGALTQSGVGDVRQGQQQAEIDQQVQNQMFNQQAPMQQASDLLGLTQAIPGGTNVTAGPAPHTSLLSGITGGLTLGSALTPFLGAAGPLVGGAIGGISSLFD